MNHAIIVAGGIGSRMNLDIPKQYYEIKGVPIILYSFRKFANSPLIDSIVIVCAKEWEDYLVEKIANENTQKRVLFSRAGISRQDSVYHGLLALKDYAREDDIVLIHDSVRPLFPESCIAECIESCKVFDGALPVISVKDATYQSHNGMVLSTILPRHELFSGQSPEGFVFGRFFKAHERFSDSEIAIIRGCSELAFKAGLSIKLIPGSEGNFKITTIEDLRLLDAILGD